MCTPTVHHSDQHAGAGARGDRAGPPPPPNGTAAEVSSADAPRTAGLDCVSSDSPTRRQVTELRALDLQAKVRPCFRSDERSEVSAPNVPVAVRAHVEQILALTDELCEQHLDSEYAELCCRVLPEARASKTFALGSRRFEDLGRWRHTSSVGPTSSSIPARVHTRLPSSSVVGSASRRRIEAEWLSRSSCLPTQ